MAYTGMEETKISFLAMGKNFWSFFFSFLFEIGSNLEFACYDLIFFFLFLLWREY